VSCSVFLWAHHFNKPAPMDDSFFLSLIGTGSCFVYLASVFLSLRFRGEFGVMPDDSVAHSPPPHSSSSGDNTATATGGGGGDPPSACSHQDENGNLVMSNWDFFSIPVQDIRYILAFYPGLRKKKKDNPLASRLFNLKLDLKDA
jgi:hypothetical protein